MSATRNVKVRSVTSFVTIPHGACANADKLKEALTPGVAHNRAMQKAIEAAGFQVQTTRIATNSFENYLTLADPGTLACELDTLAAVLKELDINFFNLGQASQTSSIDMTPDLLIALPTASASCDLLPSRALKDLDIARARSVAAACLRIARETEGGSGNFRFCAAANIGAGIPFYPAAYHGTDSPNAFSIAFENGELVYDVLGEGGGGVGGGMAAGMDKLTEALSEVYLEIEGIALKVKEETGFVYLGIDTSLNPSLKHGEGGSIVFAVERMMGDGFVWGGAGTLAVSEALTRAVKACQVKQIGYCGLMLPVLEDRGLAERAAEGGVSVEGLLAGSAVCGVGLDTVPLSGFVTEAALARTYLDVAALAHRLNKPLSCRLFPVPGKMAGERIAFPDNPYLCDSAALPLI